MSYKNTGKIPKKYASSHTKTTLDVSKRKKKDEITIEYESSYNKTVETSSRHPFQTGIELRQRLKDQKKKWSNVGFLDGYYFDTAIDVAILILDNAQFSIDDIDGKTFPNATIDFSSNIPHIINKPVQLKPKKPFTVVFPEMSKLIKNILGISESTEISKISKENKDQVEDNMDDLIDLALDFDLVDFDISKSNKAEAEWQYTILSKSLDISA